MEHDNYIFRIIHGAYLNDIFVKYLEKHQINNIIELGSRECKDSISLAKNLKMPKYIHLNVIQTLYLCVIII